MKIKEMKSFFKHIDKHQPHYHCPICSRIMEEKFRLSWTAKYGIRVIYSCTEHVAIWTENTNKFEIIIK